MQPEWCKGGLDTPANLGWVWTLELPEGFGDLGEQRWVLVSFPSSGVVSCCQASAQEIPCSTVVALVQPGRGVRGLFALAISLAERLQTGEGEV